jgi:hypothetical protein
VRHRDQRRTRNLDAIGAMGRFPARGDFSSPRASFGRTVHVRQLRAYSSVRLERAPDKGEVPGSNPGGPTRRGTGASPVKQVSGALWAARPASAGYGFEGRDAPGRADVGDVAQLGERLPCTEKVTGSSPVVSTNTPDGRVARPQIGPWGWNRKGADCVPGSCLKPRTAEQPLRARVP